MFEGLAVPAWFQNRFWNERESGNPLGTVWH
jgi:hypothetical protein